MEKFILQKGLKFNQEEKEYLTALKQLEKEDNYIKKERFQHQFKTSIQSFMVNHRDDIFEFYNSNRRIAREKYLEEKFKVKKDIASDIMLSQDISNRMIVQMTPVPVQKLKVIQQQISTPFIAEYISLSNKNVAAKIQMNRNNGGSVLNNVPEAKEEKVFDLMMKKYRGKVVLIDFWATWCAPCRAGIERIKPLKDEMSGNGVVFVYISGPSSPLETYKNMIPGIKGEHFRVSNDQWNYLCKKFNITGIPHQMIIDKKGVVVNSHLMLGMNNEMLKKEMEKYLP